MNIKILAAAAVLASAFATTAAHADDHGSYERSRGGESRGHWDHDRRGYGDHGGGYRGHDRQYGYGRPSGDYRRDDWRHDGYRGSYWSNDYRGYHPHYGYRPYYGYAPRYYAPSYYAPSYYAPYYDGGGWFDDLGVVIQFNLH